MISSCRPFWQLDSILVTILLGLCGAAALLFLTPLGRVGLAGRFSPAEARVGEYDPSQYMTGVLYTSGVPNVEGYGSFLQHWRGACVHALFLNKTLIIQQDEVQSEHGYFVSPQINAVHAWPEMPRNDSSDVEVCDSTDYWGQHGMWEGDMLALMCFRMYPGSFKDPADMFLRLRPSYSTQTAQTLAATGTSAVAAWERQYANCTVIKSVQLEWKSRFEEFNDCVQPWLSYTLRGMFANRGYQSNLADNGRLNVGVHIRWGDFAAPDGDVTKLNPRNMDRQAMISTLQKLQESSIQLNFYIFAEDAIPGLVEQFQVEHTLVNGEDDLYDMYLYSLMDVYILGSSSWSVMPSYVHSGRVIITDNPEHPKLKPVFRQVNQIYHFQNLTYLEHIARLRPQSAERAAATYTKPSTP